MSNVLVWVIWLAAAAEARVDGPLELGVLLSDRLPEDLTECDAEPFEGPERLG